MSENNGDDEFYSTVGTDTQVEEHDGGIKSRRCRRKGCDRRILDFGSMPIPLPKKWAESHDFHVCVKCWMNTIRG